MSERPLKGITVLDFSTRLPGPLASLMLAQAGARVIKVERPAEGDEVRAFAPRLNGMSAHFAWLNRGKESLALDLKRPQDVAVLRSLLKDTDVLIEQFRPGVMARLGLGYADLARDHPRLVYCSITGFGQADPRSMEAAHDLNYQAASGLVGDMPLLANGMPALPSVLLGDIAGGSYPAFMSILLALMQRASSGRGQHVDIAMSQNVEVFAFWNAIEGSLTGRWPTPGKGRHTGGSPRYQLYRTRDGQFLAVAALEDRFWRNFLDAVGLDVTAEQERETPEAVVAAVAERLASQDAEYWLRIMAGRDTCCNLASRLDQAVRANARRRHRAGDPLPSIPLPLAPQFTTEEADQKAPELGSANQRLLVGAD